MVLNKALWGVAAAGALFTLAIAPAQAEWTEPVEIIQGKFGNGKGEVSAAADSAGELVSGIDTVLADGTVMISDRQNGKLLRYNSAGKLLNEEEGKTTASPRDRKGPGVAEASSVNSEIQESRKYKITVTFPDKTVVMESSYEFPRFVRDIKGRIYGIGPERVWRFAEGASFPAELVLPRPREELLPKPVVSRGRTYIGVYVDFGPPVISPNGDVYSWKTSDLGFSVVKWTWMEEPSTDRTAR